MNSKIPQDRQQATVADITVWPSPLRVHIPLIQHRGRSAKVIVNEGQRVSPGQTLTYSEDLFEVPVHASIHGTVETIENGHITIVNNTQLPTDTPCLTENQSNIQSPFSTPFTEWSREQFIQQIHQSGLVGLGGSCFPVAAKLDKLSQRCADVLLINAAECDPAIACDEALLKNSIDEIANGIVLAQLATQARKTIIGIEADKNAIGQHLLAAVREKSHFECSIHQVPAGYPNGAESLLMSHCTGQNLSPADIHQSDLITFNVGTCYALDQALRRGKPCSHRIATVIDSLQQIHNIKCPVGTPMIELIAHFEQPPHAAVQIFVGGEMMGKQVAHTDVVTKASNCIQLKRAPTTSTSRACIRCGLCVDACPVKLMPQHLLAQEANSTALQQLNLHHCIECACCDRVCPSHIPLATTFARAKHRIESESQSQQRAQQAKDRFEKRQTRLELSEQREFRQLDKKQSNLQKSDGQSAKRKLVAEALRRAKEKKQKKPAHEPPANTENNSVRGSPDNDTKF